MDSSNQYDADYFLRGKQSGKSLYENYRWLPDLTIPMVSRMIAYLGIKPEDTILDFGCARGYIVRAFREMGYNAWGYDISKWAIENADKEAAMYLYRDEIELCNCRFSWVIAKDVLEHVLELSSTIDMLRNITRKGIFAVVPLAHGSKYDVREYEEDITHIHRRPLQWWVGHFHQVGWSVEARYQVDGIKDNYAQWKTGNGFIVARSVDS